MVSKMFRQSIGLVAILCGLCLSLCTGWRITSRIVGGTDAGDISVPWMASIINYGQHVCGGSIINERTILTAAHCVRYASPALLKVRVGTKTRSSGGQYLLVDSTAYHPEFHSSTMDYDIGIIRLSSDIEFSHLAQPIALQKPGEGYPDGTAALVTGWGYATALGPIVENLKYAVVPLINQATCNRLMKNKITDRMLCAGYLKGGVDACTMDSGGPLVVGSKLVGIVSWGISCALPKLPGIYTRVSVLYPWVEESLQQFGEKLQ